jgi:hypothetical protein
MQTDAGAYGEAPVSIITSSAAERVDLRDTVPGAALGTVAALLLRRSDLE